MCRIILQSLLCLAVAMASSSSVVAQRGGTGTGGTGTGGTGGTGSGGFGSGGAGFNFNNLTNSTGSNASSSFSNTASSFGSGSNSQSQSGTGSGTSQGFNTDPFAQSGGNTGFFNNQQGGFFNNQSGTGANAAGGNRQGGNQGGRGTTGRNTQSSNSGSSSSGKFTLRPQSRIAFKFKPVDRTALATRLVTRVRSQAPAINGKPIEVAMADTGKVTLKGQVDSEESRRLLEAYVRLEPGVYGIDNQLVIAGEK